MRRKIKPSRYIIAAILTVIIFSLGSIFGLFIESKRVSYVEALSMEQKVDYSSLQVQQLFLDTYHNELSCDVANELYESSLTQLENSLKKLRSYKKKSAMNSEDFDLILRDYFLTEIKYILLAKKLESSCPADNVRVIYFYSEQEDVDYQGYVLDFAKKLFGDRLLVFSFNSDFKQEPMIDVMLNLYGVDTFPAVVIEDEKFEGFMDKDVLVQEICSKLKVKPDSCN